MIDYSKIHDTINKYLAGRLTEEERVNFEKKLESNPELKVEFDFQKILFDSLMKLKKNEIIERAKNVRTSIELRHKTRRIRLLTFTNIAAGLLFLLVPSILFFMYRQTDYLLQPTRPVGLMDNPIGHEHVIRCYKLPDKKILNDISKIDSFFLLNYESKLLEKEGLYYYEIGPYQVDNTQKYFELKKRTEIIQRDIDEKIGFVICHLEKK